MTTSTAAASRHWCTAAGEVGVGTARERGREAPVELGEASGGDGVKGNRSEQALDVRRRLLPLRRGLRRPEVALELGKRFVEQQRSSRKLVVCSVG